MDNGSFLSAGQVAKLFGVNPATVRTWVEKGWLEASVTPGKHRRYKREDVDKLAKERGLTLVGDESGGRRIMLVDDDTDLTTLISYMFDNYTGELAVEVANSGFQAGIKVEQFKPDTILLDLTMPGLSGFEVCKTLKANPETYSIRVIAMTADLRQERVDKILDLGAEKVLRKPFSEEELYSACALTNEKVELKA